MTLPAAADKRAIVSWALYDFANSPFTTLVITFVYSTYFTQAIASDPIAGTAQWSRAVTATALIVALTAPLLGAVADRGGYRKAFLVGATLVCAAATAALYWVVPGQVLLALGLFVVANIAYELGVVFYNAYLPDIAPRGRIGTVSGLAWGCGYIGGLLALGLALVGLVQPEQPWLGFSTEAGENVRASNLLVAAWFVVFSLPMFVFVTDTRARRVEAAPGSALGLAFGQLVSTFTELKRYRETMKFLVARLVYNDGLVTVFAFGGIYAAETFGFSIQQVLVFGIVLNLAAGLGAAAMGFLDDYVGAKLTIIVSLLGLITATSLAIVARDAAALWTAGVLIGIFVGPNQAASRSLMGRFTPAGMENEFFGLFAFSGKLTAFIGPFLLGVVTAWSGSQRAGVSVVLVLFVLGLGLLLSVDERAGATARDAA